MDQREPVGAGEHVEHRLRSGSAAIAAARSWAPGGSPDPRTPHATALSRAASTAARPASVIRPCSSSVATSATFRWDQLPLGRRGVMRTVCCPVALAGLAVDPAEAEQLLDRARPLSWCPPALLGQHQPHAGRRRMVLFEPRPQRGPVGHEQLGQQVATDPRQPGPLTAASLGDEPGQATEHDVQPGRGQCSGPSPNQE